MNQSQIATIFNKKFNGQPNFVTPHLVEFGTAGPDGQYIYELSKSGPDPSSIFGILWGATILTKDGHKTTLSNSFRSEKEARHYIDQIGI